MTCGMTLIAPTWAVTGSHCILKRNLTDGRYYELESGEGSEMTFGCTDLMSHTCKRTGIKRWVPHPCYYPSSDHDHDDIALAELESPVHLAQYPKIAGIDGRVELPERTAVAQIGMGNMGYNSEQSEWEDGMLHQIWVQTVNKSYCASQDQRDPPESTPSLINFDRVICTGGKEGKDSCGGDSGGPVLACVDGEDWLVGTLVKGSEYPRIFNPRGLACGVKGYSQFIQKSNCTLTGSRERWLVRTLHATAAMPKAATAARESIMTSHSDSPATAPS